MPQEVSVCCFSKVLQRPLHITGDGFQHRSPVRSRTEARRHCEEQDTFCFTNLLEPNRLASRRTVDHTHSVYFLCGQRYL